MIDERAVERAVERALLQLSLEGSNVHSLTLALYLGKGVPLDAETPLGRRAAKSYLENVSYYFLARRRERWPRRPARRSRALTQPDYDRLWEVAKLADQRWQRLLEEAVAAGVSTGNVGWLKPEQYQRLIGEYSSPVRPEIRLRPSLLSARLAA